MIGPTRCLGRLAACTVLCVLAATAGAATASASTSCGVVTAAGHPRIVVAKSVSCPPRRTWFAISARARRPFGRAGPSSWRGRSPASSCVLSSHGKPGGSCSTAGGVRSVLWLSAV